MLKIKKILLPGNANAAQNRKPLPKSREERPLLIRDQLHSGTLPLFALTAEVRPGHRFETNLRDRLLADHTYAKRALSDAIQCLFDRSQETPIGLMQADLKLRLGIGVGLVNQITLPASSCRHPSLSVALGSTQAAPLFQ